MTQKVLVMYAGLLVAGVWLAWTMDALLDDVKIERMQGYRRFRLGFMVFMTVLFVVLLAQRSPQGAGLFLVAGAAATVILRKRKR